jgi:hypothetical protein
MSIKVMDGGSWKEPTSLKVMNSGSWTTITDGWVMEGGVWKKFYAQTTTSPPTCSIITNCDFATDLSGWMDMSGKVTCSNSQAVMDHTTLSNGDSLVLYQGGISLQASKTYELNIKVDYITAGQNAPNPACDYCFVELSDGDGNYLVAYECLSTTGIHTFSNLSVSSDDDGCSIMFGMGKRDDNNNTMAGDGKFDWVSLNEE